MEQLKAHTGYAPVDGLDLYYEIYGSGHPLVLLHGGGSTIGTTFGRIIPFLAKHYQVIGVELQAHGHTADRDTPTSFAQDAKDVVGVLHHLRIPKAHVMGFSNGGQTAMQIGISHPEVVDRLIIASAFYKREGAIPWLWEGMPNATLDNMPGPFQDAYLAITHDNAGLLRMFNRDKERMLNFQDWPDEEVGGIQAPTLVLISNDDVATPEHAAAMARLLPNGKLVILPGGHGECLGDILFPDSYLPAVTAQIVQNFLG